MAGRGPSLKQKGSWEIWARAAGVCERPGCGAVLYRSWAYHFARVNLGQKAHIVASSQAGPRGDPEQSSILSDDPNNFLLLCPTCHVEVDKFEERYRVKTLMGWKSRHERAVLCAAKMTGMRSAVPLLVKSSRIGGRAVSIAERGAIDALFETDTAPAIPALCLNVDARIAPNEQVRQLIDELRSIAQAIGRSAENAELAVFPLGEMPILMAVGHAIGDKRSVTFFPFHRASNSWSFPAPNAELEFRYSHLSSCGEGEIGLIISLSASIAPERVTSILGADAQLIELTVDDPNVAIVQSQGIIAAFRDVARRCLTEIENQTPRGKIVHVFPCMPAALACAFGACIMPKVSNPIQIYDAAGPDGQFHSILTLPDHRLTEAWGITNFTKEESSD